MREKWRSITLDGFRDTYEVSNFGRVRTTPRIVTQFVNKSLNPVQNKLLSKRLMVALQKGEIGKRRERCRFLVSRLVAAAFCDKSPEATVVNHIDGNPLNNHASNLEWTTPEKNNLHAKLMRLHPRGSKHYAYKVNPKIAVELRKQGKSLKDIAKHFGCYISTVSKALAKEGWERKSFMKVNDHAVRGMWESGLKARDIAITYRVCESAVYKSLKRTKK